MHASEKNTIQMVCFVLSTFGNYNILVYPEFILKTSGFGVDVDGSITVLPHSNCNSESPINEI